MTRRAALALSVTVVVWAAAVVPMPFYEVQPGSARPVEELLVLSAAVSEVSGDLDLLTTKQSRPNVAEAVWIALHPDRDLLPAAERVPAGVDEDRFFAIQEQAFRTSFLTAVAVAARETGLEVELSTRAVVAHVVPDAPSRGLLEPGDVITAIDGTAVTSGEDLVAELGRRAEPATWTLDVLRDGDDLTVEVTTRVLDDSGRPVLGIVVETVADDPTLPFDADVDRDGIVGPSAGLMLAVTAADLLLEEDLASGRVVAGTGTIALDGTVGIVSGVEQKSRAAVAAGADLLLVPIDLLDETGPAQEAGIPVVGVRTFQDALDALRGDTDNLAAPRP